MTILYFGTYNPDWGRSKIYMKGLRDNGIEIIECRDNSNGLLKYWKLWKKHRSLRGSYDALIVGYPGHAVVWFARLISKRQVIFDALCTMEEGVLISRGQGGFLGLKAMYIRFIDKLAVKSSDIVLVESEAQKKYFEDKFGSKNDKYRVIYTGADESDFFKDDSIKKNAKFTVVFRGKFLPEAGVEHIIRAAKILENKDVDFFIIGNGFLEREVKSLINELKPGNLILISEHLSFDELRRRMLSSHISLGQLEDHERLSRTIPHKCFETLAMGLPYVTARAKPVSEILKDGESVVFVNPADPEDLAEKILMLKNNKALLDKIGENGFETYKENLTPKALAKQIQILTNTLLLVY